MTRKLSEIDKALAADARRREAEVNKPLRIPKQRPTTKPLASRPTKK
jgi:hypothetical protein